MDSPESSDSADWRLMIGRCSSKLPPQHLLSALKSARPTKFQCANVGSIGQKSLPAHIRLRGISGSPAGRSARACSTVAGGSLLDGNIVLG